MSSPTVYEDAVLLPYYEGDFHREEEFGLPEIEEEEIANLVTVGDVVGYISSIIE